QFNSDVSPLLLSMKMPARSYVNKIVKTGTSDFWFLFSDSGIYRYNAVTRQTKHYDHNIRSSPSLYSHTIADIAPDSKGNIWIAYSDRTIEMLDAKANKISHHSSILTREGYNDNLSFSLTIDKDNDLWLYTRYSVSGIYYYKPSTGAFRRVDEGATGVKLNTEIVNNIVQADDGLIWIATDHGGINILDKKDFKITYLQNRDDDPTSLAENSVSLYKDNLGIMWAGTFKMGLSYYHKNIIKFPRYRHFASDPGSLSYNDVDAFVEDKLGNLWIGTNGGGLLYFNRKTGKFTQYKHDPGRKNSLGGDIIVSLCMDHDQKLWIGTYLGGLDCFDGKVFTNYRHNDQIATSIADDRIWSIFEDSSHRLWIGTFEGGLEIFDRSKKVFYHPFSHADIRSSLISSIFEDRQGNIWTGGYIGVDVILKGGKRIVHYSRNANGVNSLIYNTVKSINEDSRGLIWIATSGGLSILDPKTNTFTSLTKENGLPGNYILNTLEDTRGTIWVSTSNGLCRVTLKPGNGTYRFQCENFDETDGLQGREFNEHAAAKTSKGELIFGGGAGFNIFDPTSLGGTTDKPRLIFTDFQLFNKSISANEAINGHILLSKSITVTPAIVLNHSESVFSIEFAALDFFNPGKEKYQYMLEGFDEGWVNADNRTRKATYTNLDGGDYIFKVRASNSEGIWNPGYISIKIKVLPPFWKSTMAYIVYLALLIGVLFIIRQRGIEKIKRQFVIEQEKREASLLIEQERREAQLLIEQERQEVKRIRDLDELKIKFLTNVSHEFRTPLSLIMGPVEKMLKISHDIEHRAQLGIIGKNARRLLNLVNQLLDFRKMEVQELKLHCTPGDIIKFVKESTLSFQDIADEKNIVLAFDTDIETLITSFDHDKIERILFNLLSNAFKFTHGGGNVSVLLSKIQTQSTEKYETIEIKIIDTGIGIDKDKQDKIFERFFQSDLPKSLINQGSGIGLAITREFVKMHNGDITVESEPGYGSCFIVRLPLPVNHSLLTSTNLPDEIENEWTDVRKIEVEKVLTKPQYLDKKPVVLLVEDNEDFRFYLKDNLKNIFFIIEATNGKEGWQKALSQHPDIIVSDISMPEMDGIDLCKKIKNDDRTLHMPIILLTARTGEEEQLKGLEIGANDYMTKPFNFEILLSRIRNLLTLQDTFKQTYKKQMNVQLLEETIESEDEKLFRNIVEFIEQNISNDNLSVEELSRHVNMSRGTLYKKLLTLTGKSPVEFIRSIRLKKAVYLLENSQKSISQISYEVGFNEPRYFTKVFKNEYNILPSDYVTNIRQNKISNKSENK
ncbi:MAG: two-component regulator propeller domain-containing protein, partial [Sphingobacteriales bacterium]